MCLFIPPHLSVSKYASAITYVNTQFDNIILNYLNYDARDEPNMKCLTKSDKLNTYNKSEVDLTFVWFNWCSPWYIIYNC